MPILLLLAVALTPSARVQREAEDRARSEVADLLRTLCPEQCVILSITARVEDDEVTRAEPGFDSPGDAVAPVLRKLNASLVVDGKLPSAFRAKVKDLVGQRLRVLGVPGEVALQSVDFPVRNPPHLEAPPPPMPQSAPVPQAAPPAPAPAPATLKERLLQEAPALAAAVLFAIVTMFLGTLFFLAARRSRDPAFETIEADPVAATLPEAPQQQAGFTEPRRRKLELALHDERVVRNAVVRDALERGETPLVARWVREMGDFLLDDLRGDATASNALAAVASEIVRAGPDPASLAVLEGRVIAARLSRAAESGDAAFAFLEGVREDAFGAACRDLSPAALDAALRFAPARLRSAALDGLSAEQRHKLAVSWATRPEVPVSQAIAAAEELRDRLDRIGGGPLQAQRALADLVDSLPRVDQDALVERIRRESGRVPAAFLTESALSTAPADAVGAAVLGLPVATVATYLSAADADLRERILSTCPARLRRELEEELQVRAAASRVDFVGARRDLLTRLREEITRRAAPSPAPINGGQQGQPERAAGTHLVSA